MVCVGISDLVEMPGASWPRSSHDKNKCRHPECSCFQHRCYLLKFIQGTIPSRQISDAQGEFGGNSNRKLQLQERLLMCCFVYHLASCRTASICVKRLDNNKKNTGVFFFFLELCKICCLLSENVAFLTGKC